jgi:hypothetical protein
VGEEEVGLGVPRRLCMRVVFVGLAGYDGLWDLPSWALGVCYSDSQPVFGFKAA